MDKTLELFRLGKSFPEIAFERKLAFSTIETHFAILLAHKRIIIDELLPLEKIGLIKKAVPEIPKTLTEIKDLLPKEISFGEIRWVLASMGKLKEKRFSRTPPIVRAVNTYRGNNCFRKCFRHKGIIGDCGEKFGQVAKSFGNDEIGVGEFYGLVNSGKLKICKLSEKQRWQVIVWKKFEEMSDEGKDFWD